jgi:hypothetical protein
MTFQPQIGQELHIEHKMYRIAEHPAAPGLVYGQEGRQATVYQLDVPTTQTVPERLALKVFKPRYRIPTLAKLSERLAPLGELPGLQVWQRCVLTPKQHPDLLRQHTDLTYSVLMPWVEGPTWFEIVMEKRELTVLFCQMLAHSLTTVLVGIEQRGAAHCDLSGANVLLPALESARTNHLNSAVALVDVEQFYFPSIERPLVLPGGSAGYAHKTATAGIWSAEADRFAGAVLLAEMLGWGDERVRTQAFGESFFDSAEMQQDCARYTLLHNVLHERWSTQIAELFKRAWESESLEDCPTFGEWLVMLPELSTRNAGEAQTPAQSAVSTQAIEAAIQTLLNLGQQLYDQGNRNGALDAWRKAFDLVPDTSSLRQTILEKIRLAESPVPGSLNVSTDGPPVAGATTTNLNAFPIHPWQSENIQVTKTHQLRTFVVLSIGVAVAALLLILAFGNLLYSLGMRLVLSLGEAGRQAIVSGILAMLVGSVEVWVFRQRIQTPRQRFWFIVAAMFGGIFGGGVAGGLVGANVWPLWAMGSMSGWIAGGIAGLWQNKLMRTHGAEKKWFLWNLSSWAIIWFLGWWISWGVPGIGGTALGTAFILIISGAMLAYFLNLSPEIEF